MIDKMSVIPLYHQIEQDIKDKIKTNYYPVNEPIPSEIELIEQYNVSRMTVRLAIEELEKEGYVKKIQGKGTYVIKRKLTQELNTITSWSETLREQGMYPDVKILEIIELEASAEMAKKMSLKPKSKLYFIKRLKSVDNEPIGISQIYIVADIVPGIINDPLIKDSVYQVMESKYCIELAVASEVVEARGASKEEAALMKVEIGTPLITVKRLTSDAFGNTIELSEITSRADRYSYKVTLRGRKKWK